MKIVRLNEYNLQQSADIIIEAFGDQYRRMFAIDLARLKPFVEFGLKTNETWVLEGSETMGVLILEHKFHKGAGYSATFKILLKSIPFWSVIYSARYILAPRISLKDSVHIDQIAVGRDFQNQRIGAQLLQFAQDRAKELGFCSINLRVRADNPAINLYKRFGFEVYREISSAIFSNTLGCKTVVYMIKNLVP